MSSIGAVLVLDFRLSTLDYRPPTIELEFDHLVLTVADIEATCRFYCEGLGMERITFGEGRTALRLGPQKLNLHQAGHEFEPRAAHPAPGSADLCLRTKTPLEAVQRGLEQAGIAIEEGPIARTGARTGLLSLYVRDPDGNLIEIANEVN